MASSYIFICAWTSGSTISTPPRCCGGAGKFFFFIDLDLLGTEDPLLPRDARDVDFCAFAMARTLAEEASPVNEVQNCRFLSLVPCWIAFTVRQHAQKYPDVADCFSATLVGESQAVCAPG